MRLVDGCYETVTTGRDDSGYVVLMRRIPIALAALLALGGLGACGDDDDVPEEARATTTTSEDETDVTTTSTTEDELERDDPGTDNTTPSQGLIELEATLSGDGLSGGEGDKDGSGVASVRVDVNNRELCFTLGTQSLEDPTAAHIHDGLEGEEGAIVVALAPPQNGSVDGCINKLAADLATKLAGNPERYYVDVHTKNATGPALRGQLEAMP